MTHENIHTKRNGKNHIIHYTSIGLYVLVLIVAVALLLIESIGFDAAAMIVPSVLALLVTALGFSYSIASKGTVSQVFTVLGATLLTLLFAVMGFMVVAGTAYYIATQQ